MVIEPTDVQVVTVPMFHVPLCVTPPVIPTEPTIFTEPTILTEPIEFDPAGNAPNSIVGPTLFARSEIVAVPDVHAVEVMRMNAAP